MHTTASIQGANRRNPQHLHREWELSRSARSRRRGQGRRERPVHNGKKVGEKKSASSCKHIRRYPVFGTSSTRTSITYLSTDVIIFF